MKLLITKHLLSKYKFNEKIPCKCYYCGNTFYREKKFVLRTLNNDKFKSYRYEKSKYCSTQCANLAQKNKEKIKCSNCNSVFEKTPSQIKKSKSGNHFCSKSCAATFNNKNKTYGTRRSKLENWLENQLNELYPELEILFNNKEAIGSELDIYIPSLNLAFELNGIFHYEPIYGNNKLEQIQENDQSKSKACHDAKIDLCVIDVSQQKYFKEKTSKKYLDIINNVVNQRIMLNS